MAIDREYFVAAQNSRTLARDLNDDPSVINSYFVGNRTYIDYSDGTSIAFVTDVDATQPSGYLIAVELFGSNGELQQKLSGFRHFVTTTENSWTAAITKITVADENVYLSQQDDWFLFDPAGDAIEDNREAVQNNYGSVLFVDGRGGIDTFADTVWGSDDIHLGLNSNGTYTINFLPTGVSYELRNFEYIDLADKPSMTLAEYHAEWNSVPNNPAEWSSSTFTPGPYFVGDQITAVLDATDPDGVGIVTHSWYREKDGVTQFTGVTGSQYTISFDDVGHELRVKASYTDNAGNFEESSLWGYYSTPYVVQERIINSPAELVSYSFSSFSAKHGWDYTGDHRVGQSIIPDIVFSDANGIENSGETALYRWYLKDPETGYSEFLSMGDQTTLVLTSNMIGKSVGVGLGFTDDQGNEEFIGPVYSEAIIKPERLTNMVGVSESIIGTSALDELFLSDQALADVALSLQNNRLVVQTGSETDTLISVERVHFNDVSIGLDDISEQAYRVLNNSI
jgi:hypothetical protein